MLRSIRHAPAALAALTLLTFAPAAEAQDALYFQHAGRRAIRVDGELREWGHEHFVTAGRTRDRKLEAGFAYDDDGFFVAARVRDDRMVRTDRLGRTEDVVVLSLSMPGARGMVQTELWLFPGITGESAGAVRRAAGRALRPVEGARIVEQTRDGLGTDFEAYIPFAALPAGADFFRARARVAFRDVDGRSPREVATAPEAAARWPLIVGSGGELGMLAGYFRSRRGEAAEISHDLRANVAGDERLERIVVVGPDIVIFGPGFAGGERFGVVALGEIEGEAPRLFELVDFDGDGRSEIVVLVREPRDRGALTLLRVYRARRGQMQPVFQALVEARTRAGTVTMDHAIERPRDGSPEIIVRARSGRTPSRFRAPREDDIQAELLLPDGRVRSRRYALRGGRFVVAAEEAEPEPEPTPAATAAATPRRPTRTEPAAPSIEDLLRAARRSRRIPRGVPTRFRQEANVGEDGTPEVVALAGRTVIVVGSAYRGGRGFFHADLPAERHGDVLSMQAVDITGDGHAEILAVIRQRLNETYSREVLVVQGVTERGFPRMLVVEIARTDGTAEVRNEFRVVGRGTRARLRIQPGRARGWDASTWPFEGFADDGVAPLLLPWQDRPRTYQPEGGRLVAR